MVYTPRHPILVETARQMTDHILQQVEWHRNASHHRCKTPHECVIKVTGPMAWTAGIGAATQEGGCRNRVRTPAYKDCKHAHVASLRAMKICHRDEGTIWNTWSCNISRHWDCRNSHQHLLPKAQRRQCSEAHYARRAKFFHLGGRAERTAGMTAGTVA